MIAIQKNPSHQKQTNIQGAAFKPSGIAQLSATKKLI